MSVIAHWIEQRGISTVVIGLVREHLHKVKPPRALWVPFELGRPLGAPGNPAFQDNVLRTALELVSQQTSDSLLADFQHDDPRAAVDPDWTEPATTAFQSVDQEVRALASARENFLQTGKRSSVGVAKLDIADCAALVDSFRDAEPHKSVRADVSPNLMARYAIDDLKTFYIEAALGNSSPSSRQIYNWLWLNTHFGRELRRLRTVWMDADNVKVQALGEKFLVPHRWRS